MLQVDVEQHPRLVPTDGAQTAPAVRARALPPLLIVCLALRHGGVDVRILQTARELQRNGTRFSVVVIEGTPLHRELAREGLTVTALRRRRMDPRIAGDLVRLIRAQDAAVIDAHNFQSQLWSAVAVTFTPACRGRLATVHSVYRQEDGGRLRRRLREAALRLCHARGFRFVTVSTNVTRYLSDAVGIPAARITYSRNGMEDLAVPPRPFDLAAETGWPPGAVVLSVVGRLEPVKGHRFLISALAEIVAAGERRLRLLIVGTGREEQRLRAQVAAAGLQDHVHFTGFRDDVTSILAATDILCLPSTSEGLPYAVLEAARQSVPVLASRLEGAEEVFVDGETIVFTEPGNAAEIRARLLDLVDDPARRHALGAAARRLFIEALHVQRMLDETLAVYRAAAR